MALQITLDLPALHARAIESTRRFVTGVGEQWHARVETSACDVRTLVGHFVRESYWVEPVMAGERTDVVVDRYAGDVLGDDPVAAYVDATNRSAAAFAQPGAMEALCVPPGRPAPVPGSEFCRDRFVDLVVHGWEIANATGQDSRLDLDLAESARAAIAPRIAQLQADGIIKDALVVAEDADAQARLLAFFGYSA